MPRTTRRRGGLFVLIGILTILGVTFGAGVYAGRIWMASSTVKLARVTEADTGRRAPSRGARPPETPKPAKAVPPLATRSSTSKPGEQADMIAATTAPPTGATTFSRFTVQV